MENKKKMLPVLLSLALLGGCAAGAASQTAADTRLPETEGAASARQTDAEIVQCTAGTEGGYYRSDIYFEKGANITYIDYAAKAEVFLCGSPNCTHDNAACNSYYPYDGSTQLSWVRVVGDNLLTIQAVASEQQPPHIDLRTLDGTFQERLVSFETNQQLPGGVETDYYTDGRLLYFIVTETDSATAQTARSIVGVSLTDGTTRTLYRSPDDVLYTNIYTSCGRKLVFVEFAQTAGSEVTGTYYLLDADSGAVETMPYHVDGENTGLNFRGEEVYEIDFFNSRFTIHNLKTGEERPEGFSALNAQILADGNEVITNGVKMLPFAADACMMEYSVTDQNGEHAWLRYIMNLFTGEMTPFTLCKTFNKDIMQVVAEANGTLLVQTDWIPTQRRTGNGETDEIYLAEWILMNPEDYLSGTLRGEEVTRLDIGA